MKGEIPSLCELVEENSLCEIVIVFINYVHQSCKVYVFVKYRLNTENNLVDSKSLNYVSNNQGNNKL